MLFHAAIGARVLLGAALLLTTTILQAQDRYEIDLSQSPLLAPLSPVPIGQVLDARADRTSVGWVQIRLDNVRMPADLKGGLTAALRQVLPVPATPPAGAYTLRVLRLDVDELTRTTSETASAELVVDILRPRADGQYDLLWRGAEMAESTGLDVTSQHASNLRQLLAGLLTQFAAVGPDALPVLATLTAEQAATPVVPLEALMPFAIQREALKPGVYQSFSDFRNNTPTARRLTVVGKIPRKPEWVGTDEVEVYQVNERGGRTPVRGIWGYSDGQAVYMLYQRSYYRLRPHPHGGYCFDAPSAPDANAVAAGAVVGGLVGAAIAKSSTGGFRQEHRLSLLTGRVAPVALQADDATEGQVVVYRRKPSATVVDVYAGPRVAGGLTAGQSSVKMAWSDRRNALRLCLRPSEATPGTETCAEARPRSGETLYFEYMEGPGAPQLKAVPAKEGAFEARRAELRARQK